ncbi:hypothetical protein NIES593_22740 [Hydrococcus rivularis NIES-593]|uniref:9-O-acetyl-N-acetylneuraminate esterase n=2 Tax=Cyanophyceae TaxID=3028117 RepID=A0A1U7H736_9CYAN|nr:MULTISPECIES: hypothetical protein [Cyanophyceae]OKH10810.1 hypothetical protein NIES592_23825 [Fischerella major NIES-592]OKH12503.1 hypothetical protein FACHB389_36415 [Nostoc calcicola FACHB-389]OKH17840.1 hypothetical protein NIES593_22740 [Hydrococcus rivularis NIES-593]
MAQPGRELGEEFKKVCAAVRSGHSALVIGEAGIGIIDFAQALYEEMLGEFQAAIAIYKGSLKSFFKTIAFQLDIPTENEDGKQLTVDQLKEEIAANCSDETLLIFPEAKRLTTTIRYWLEDLLANGIRIVCFGAANPSRDIFLEMLEIELELPSDRAIREVMEAEAKKNGLTLDNSKLASLQPLAGRNPMLAKKVIRNEALGLNKQAKPEHTQYVVIMPILITALLAFGVVRFIGLGTNNKGMYITGGVCLVAGMALKQLGNVKGSRKRLGA